MAASAAPPVFSDSHVHLTNYLQEGPDARRFLEVMGTRVERAALFGIPLQQKWSHRTSGDRPPPCSLLSNARLYYYSFTDAQIAMEYLSLPPEARARFDPMITGFNPTDMYGADHVRRVLQTFPGVFTGIGEFTIHAQFVTSKISDEVASLRDPALDRLLEFAGEVGLVVLVHNDMDAPFPEEGAAPAYLAQMKELLRRHPRTRIIWAHVGVGRIARPVESHAAIIASILDDPAFDHVCFDISWDEVAKYLDITPESARNVAELVNRRADRFLFGTDLVGPTDEATYFAVYDLYGRLWERLTEEASELVRRGNYRRLFDEARRKVRAWEAAHPHAG
ncbi:MAG TPA: amidohydrolase family protein [Polyangia bacterium]|nr:amidohydrolase family protein [Polyangia bacterium]